MAATTTALFGGALTCELPQGPKHQWIDVSTMRPVPDNEEAFVLELDGQPGGCASIIIEIVERADVDDAAALEFFFKDLEEQAGAVPGGSIVDRPCLATALPLCADASYAASLSGVQRLPSARFANRVTLGLVRFPAHASDVLLSLSAGLSEDAGQSGSDLSILELLLSSASAAACMEAILQSFRLLDPGLFGGGSGADSERVEA